MALVVCPVDADRWADFDTLFEARGAPKHCWYMAFRPLDGKRQEIGPDARKQAMQQLIAADRPVGLLGYDGDRPIAWCSIAPRDSLWRIGGDHYDGIAPAHVWSISCFFVLGEHRRLGIMGDLIAAAVSHAQRHGARIVEAYPVAPDTPNYRFMGFVPVFAEAGFRFVRMAGKCRHIMRFDLD